MKKYAVIVAGGNGSRMNATVPKQFLLLKGKPVLFYTLDIFLRSYNDMQVILVLPKEYLLEGQKICDDFFNSNRVCITVGGNTRFHSVQNGLQLIKEESIVFVHDSVRCLLSVDLIHRCYETALEAGSAIPVIDSKDSVRILQDGKNESIDRGKIKLVQTPQTFKSAVLLAAFNTEFENAFTDEATVVEHSGVKVTLVPGEENNIKITKPFDLLIAEKILESN